MMDIPLYPTEAQISRLVLGPGRLDEWKAIVVILERQGFPPVDPMFGGRYWPLCELWFEVRYGMSPKRVTGKPDGVELPIESTRKKRRPETESKIAEFRR